MTNIRNALMQAAGTAASGDATYVEDVFSTTLYTGNNTNGTDIVNGIDLNGEGGLVWLKRRDGSFANFLFNTESAQPYHYLSSDSTNAVNTTSSDTLVGFNDNGFTLDDDNSYVGGMNTSGHEYASWTFRKQEGFFDIVTYTGNGSARTISHNLGSVPGMIICKSTSATADWITYHNGANNGSNAQKYHFKLNGTNAQALDNDIWDNTQPTATEFSLDTGPNANGTEYIAYLFASGADAASQIFGDDGDESIIKTGVFEGAANTTVNLGWEPQWIMFKNSSDTNNWQIVDNMRGMPSGQDDQQLMANLTNAESANGLTTITATGFTWLPSAASNYYLYVAIRRGPMKEPSAGTDVLGMNGSPGSSDNAQLTTGNLVDVGWQYLNGDGDKFFTRLLGNGYVTPTSTAAANTSAATEFDYMDGFAPYYAGNIGGFNPRQVYGFRRYPKVFDVVFYKAGTGGNLISGDGTKSVVPHNLGAVPEIIIGKDIDDAGAHWAIVWLSEGNGGSKRLNDISESYSGGDTVLNNTNPTATQVTVSHRLNGYGQNNLLLLFASLDGVCKCGTYEGTGNDINVDCGFAARFVLITGVESGLTANYPFYVYDTTRGIVSGNDPYFDLSSTAAQVTNTDYIDPHSSGFTITSSAPASLNTNNYTYGFLAFS